MMQMLQAGGMPLLIDDLRPADADNPNGYWEYEPVKRLQQDSSWIPKAEGKAVKVVSALLQYLPPQYTYRSSSCSGLCKKSPGLSTVMLERRGEQGSKADDKTLGTVFAQHLDRTEHWLATQKHMTVLPVHYHETIADPTETAAHVVQFLDLPLAVDAMAHAVNPRLYRQRR